MKDRLWLYPLTASISRNYFLRFGFCWSCVFLTRVYFDFSLSNQKFIFMYPWFCCVFHICWLLWYSCCVHDCFLTLSNAALSLSSHLSVSYSDSFKTFWFINKCLAYKLLRDALHANQIDWKSIILFVNGKNHIGYLFQFERKINMREN